MGGNADKGDVKRRRGSTTPVSARAGHAIRDGVGRDGVGRDEVGRDDIGRDGVGSAQRSHPRE